MTQAEKFIKLRATPIPGRFDVFGRLNDEFLGYTDRDPDGESVFIAARVDARWPYWLLEGIGGALDAITHFYPDKIKALMYKDDEA